MKKGFIYTGVSLLIVALLVFISVTVNNEIPSEVENKGEENMTINRNYTLLFGEVLTIGSEKNGVVEMSLNKVAGQDELKEYIVSVTADTILVDNELNETTLFNTLVPGDKVGVYVLANDDSDVKNALAVVYGKIEEIVNVHLHSVEEIEEIEDGIKVLTDNSSLYVTILEDGLKAYKTKQIVKTSDMTLGDLFLAHYDVVMLSYPGQATSDKTMIFNK